MQLNYEQRKLVEHWLKERRIASCPTCGLDNFYIGAVTPAPAMVQVICGNCAHVLLFDAQAVGVVPKH